MKGELSFYFAAYVDAVCEEYKKGEYNEKETLDCIIKKIDELKSLSKATE